MTGVVVLLLRKEERRMGFNYVDQARLFCRNDIPPINIIGAGDTLIPAAISLCSMWFVRLTLAATLAPKYGLKGVWTAMAIELTLRGTVFLARLFKGSWAEKLNIMNSK